MALKFSKRKVIDFLVLLNFRVFLLRENLMSKVLIIKLIRGDKVRSCKKEMAKLMAQVLF